MKHRVVLTVETMSRSFDNEAFLLEVIKARVNSAMVKALSITVEPESVAREIETTINRKG